MENFDNHDTFWNLVGKVLYAKATGPESRQFMELVSSDQELMEFYLRLQDYWRKIPELKTYEKIDVEADWKKVYDVILEKNSARKITPGIQRSRQQAFRKLLPYAAAIILLVVFSGLFYFQSQIIKRSSESLYTLVEAPLGSLTQVTLADGSTIWLNAGSSIRYSNHFNITNREMHLEGEAFFNVEKQDIPFVVNTFDISFTVLGTSFNLKAYKDEDVIEATLVSGSLRIEDALANTKRFREMLLTPNQKATFHRVSGSLDMHSDPGRQTEEPEVEMAVKPLARIQVQQKRTVDSEISWKEGILIVEGEPLLELARKLERRYDVRFVFKDEQLKSFKYSGTLKDQTLEQVLQAMKLTSPIEYTLVEKTVIISENPLTKSKYKDYIK